MSWLRDIRIAECLWEPLVRTDPVTMGIEPAAAESWSVSEDRLTWTFTLRKARWSDGRPLTAGDFVYAWRRALMPDLASSYAHLLFRVKGAEAFYEQRAAALEAVSAGERDPEAALAAARERFEAEVAITAVDARTLEVELVRPTPYFLELVAFATLSPVQEASVSEATRLDPATGMLETEEGYWSDPGRLRTNGPYRLAERRPGRDLLMRANPFWWNAESVRSASIREVILQEPQTALMRYRRGEIDWLPDIPTASSLAADLVTEGGADVHVGPAAGTYFYNFNCQPKRPDGSENPLADPRVRRAFSMAIDRQTITGRLTRMNQPVAHTFVPPEAIQGYAPPASAGARFDPEAAAALLEEAGYPGGKGLEGLTLLYNTGGGHEMIAQHVVRGWQTHLGVAVELEGIDSVAFGSRLDRQAYAIARAGWFGDYRDPTTFLDKFLSESPNNDAAWRDAAYDRLMAGARDLREPAARMDRLREAEARMLEAQPIAPIFHYVNLELFDPERVKGLHPNPWNVRRLERVEVSAPSSSSP